MRTAAALALYAATAVLFTWPLCLHPASHVLDDGTLDGLQYVWNLWWVRTALLDLHASPFHTRFLFFPEGIDLFWHTLSVTTGLLSMPFALLGRSMRAAVAAHNAVTLAALPATAATAAFLVREVTGRRGVGVVAALLLVASPLYVRQLHIAHLASVYWLLGALVVWQRLHAGRRWGAAVGVAALLVLQFFASQDCAAMAIALLVFDLGYRVLARRGPCWLPGAAAALGLALAAVGASTAAFAGAAPERPSFQWVVWNSGYLTGFFTPPWIATGGVYFSSSLYLGTAPLVLAVLAQVIAPRAATRWNLGALVFLVATLGPSLQLGPPPPTLDRVWPGWPLPYRLAYALVPGVSLGRAPWRWVAVARVCCVLAAACGLAELARRWAAAPVRTRLAAVGLVAVAIAETLPERLFIERATLPAAYDVIRQDDGHYAVLDLPSGIRILTLGLFSSRYMAYQTGHGRPLVEGTVARRPPDRPYVFERPGFQLAEHPEVKYVVVHRPLFHAVYPRAPSVRLAKEARRLGDLVFRDRDTRVYRLPMSGQPRP